MLDNDILNGVGKKLRNLYLAGKATDKEILLSFNRNKKEAEETDFYGWSLFDLIQEQKTTHNPLLRAKLEKLIAGHRQKSSCSRKQNDLSIAKLSYYMPTALGIGIRPTMRALKRIAGRGDNEAEIIATLIDLELANITAKKKSHLTRVIYERKGILLRRVSLMLKEVGWRYGITDKTGKNAGWLIYVYLPDGTQLSWHCNDYKMLYYFEGIECEWDGRICSTMEKLLSYANSKFNIGKPLVEYELPLAG